MSVGLSENKLNDSNGLSSNNEGEMNTSEDKKGILLRTKKMIPVVLQLLKCSLICSSTLQQLTNPGQKVP